VNQAINPNTKKISTLISYKRESFYFVLFFTLIGFVLSFSQILGNSPDYDNYEIFFDLLGKIGLDALDQYRFEPGFTTVAFMLTFFISSNLLVYSTIVSCVMLIKGVVIYLVSPTKKVMFVTAIFYFARYFSLHELTQLRAACGVGFLLIAGYFIWSQNRRLGLLACATGVAFHFSSLALIPALLVRPITKYWHAVLIASLAYVTILLSSNFVAGVMGNYMTVFNEYNNTGFGDQAVSLMTPPLLLDWLMIATSLVMWQHLSPLMRQIVLLELIGMAIFYGAKDFPVVAHRMREFYSVFWVFFVADGLKRKSINVPVSLFVFASIVIYLYLFVISGRFFDSVYEDHSIRMHM